jgi:nickel-dependent lactate racemase
MISQHYGFTTEEKGSPPAEKKRRCDVTTPVPQIQILPALGTHAPMTTEETRKMFGQELASKEPSPFLVHDWRNDVVTIGEAPAEMVKAATRGMVDEPWPAQLNKIVWDKRRHDPTAKQKHKSLVLSIGQVVPHEVMGMANFNKNLFVGTGGVEAINLSHFIGAVHGMERMMGRKENPLRAILNYASEKYLESELDLWYILTVVSSDKETGNLAIRGLYIGRDIQCYSAACDLSLKVNFTLLDEPVKRMVAYLDAEEFQSTWLGNKAIYRTRMAMADDGELIILAPGVARFGEDNLVDQLIRKYGYKGTPAVMKMMEENDELKENLSAVAHLIHGSTEGRFKVTYCPGHLSKAEVETAGFQYADLDEMSERFDVKSLKDGWNSDDDGQFFFVSNPALGLWAVKSRFEGSDS